MNDVIPMAQIRREMLRTWMEQNRVNGTELALRLGVGRAYTSLIMRPEKHFGEKAARSIERKLYLPSGYLDGKPTSGAVESWSDPKSLPDGSIAMVPIVYVTANHGVLAQTPANLPPIGMTKEWLVSKGSSSRDSLRFTKMRGESMAPYLQDEDIVMFDFGQTDIEDSKVYCIQYGSEIKIRKLSLRYDDSLIIKASNLPDEVVSPEHRSSIKVLGRVLFRLG